MILVKLVKPSTSTINAELSIFYVCISSYHMRGGGIQIKKALWTYMMCWVHQGSSTVYPYWGTYTLVLIYWGLIWLAPHSRTHLDDFGYNWPQTTKSSINLPSRFWILKFFHEIFKVITTEFLHAEMTSWYHMKNLAMFRRTTPGNPMLS